MDAREYKQILAEHGRRVANRVAYAALRDRQSHDLGAFYLMYGTEDALPESERCKTGLISKFDPTKWNALYANHPTNEFSLIYMRTKGASARWFAELKGARETWGAWVIDFIHKSLVLDQSNEVCDAIADNQGEYITRADRCRYCGWFPGWRGWIAWANSLSDNDISVLCQMFEPHTAPRHPEPGSPEAEAWLEKHRND